MSEAAHIDFETQSCVDLKSRALDVYANDLTTRPHCLGFAFDDEPVFVARSKWGGDRMRHMLPGPQLDRLLDHVAAGRIVYAHNAAFEWAIWNKVCAPLYGWPELKASQLRCTMAMAYAMSLPGALEHLAAALGLDMQKDMQGNRVMMQIARPKTSAEARRKANCPRCEGRGWDHFLDCFCACTEWQTDESKYERTADYCATDVETERAAHRRLLELIPVEQELWTLDHAINNRGVQIDVTAARAALDVIASEKKRLDRDMRAATGGAVEKCTSVAALTGWVREQGVEVDGIAKADIIDLLDSDLPGDEQDIFGEIATPGPVRQALTLRQEAGKSSLAKLDKMMAVMGSDGRVRNTKQYHAASTGRWGGRHTQFDNLPRPPKWLKTATDQNTVLNAVSTMPTEDAIAYIVTMYGPALDALVACVRAFLIARHGCDLVAVDFSNIEGRVLAWLAGEEWKLDAFRAADNGTGPGIYELTYARSFDVAIDTVDEFMRQIGKVVELACGFGGGVGAFQAMAKVYNVKVSDKQADEFKSRWRSIHPEVVGYWKALETAAINAVLFGNTYSAGPEGREVRFKVNGSFLWCRLPSSRCLCYPYPKILPVEMPWGEVRDALTFMAVPGDDPKARARLIPDPANTNKWARHKTYGGSLAENVTQAAARDLLAEAIVRVESRGFPVVMHVHDEIVCEVPSESPQETLDLVAQEMCRLPAWAEGLPVTAAGWRGKRYRKG